MAKTIFIDGDGSLGISGTIVSAAFLNALQNHKHDGKDQDGSAPIEVPFGAEMLWPTETPPTGWLEENGASLVRATYPDLFTAIGTMYGAADSTHFNLPDARGRFPRIWAHGQTTDPDRATRTAPTVTGATISAGDHVGTNESDALQGHHHANYNSGTAGTNDGFQVTQSSTILKETYIMNPITDGINGTPRTSSETRAINTNRMMIIKAY